MPAECCRKFFAKLCDDEPVFTLAGRDKLAPAVVAYWIKLAGVAGVNQDKIARAEQHLQAIHEFQIEHPLRTKIPD